MPMFVADSRAKLVLYVVGASVMLLVYFLSMYYFMQYYSRLDE